jgi:hypothetical protein
MAPTTRNTGGVNIQLDSSQPDKENMGDSATNQPTSVSGKWLKSQVHYFLYLLFCVVVSVH